MNLNEIINEQFLNEAINKQQLAAVVKALNHQRDETRGEDVAEITPETVTRWVDEADPSKRNKYSSFILRQLKYGNVIFPEDISQVRADLAEFINYINAGGLEEGEGDINSYERISDLRKKLDELQKRTGDDSDKGVGSKLQFNPNMPGIKLFKKDGELKVWEVTDEDALAQIGKGTKWCTREDAPGGCQAEYYLKQHGKIYVITDAGKVIAQYTPDYSQVLNINDAPLFDDEGELNVA